MSCEISRDFFVADCYQAEVGYTAWRPARYARQLRIAIRLRWATLPVIDGDMSDMLRIAIRLRWATLNHQTFWTFQPLRIAIRLRWATL